MLNSRNTGVSSYYINEISCIPQANIILVKKDITVFCTVTVQRDVAITSMFN